MYDVGDLTERLLFLEFRLQVVSTYDIDRDELIRNLLLLVDYSCLLSASRLGHIVKLQNHDQ